jgi:hypothetical protein
MGRPKKQQDDFEDSGDVTGEYKGPNAKRAFEIYDEHIAPKLTQIATISGDCKEPWQMVKTEANVPRSVLNFVIKLDEEEDDAKRDHMLLSLHECLRARNLALPEDLATLANGTAGAEVVPIGGRNKPFMPGVSDDDDGDDFED